MNFKILLKYSFKNLFRKKSRTFLAILAIVIAIVAILLLLSFTQGIYEEYTKTIDNLKGIILFSNSVPDPSMDTISKNYFDKLKKIKGIDKIIMEDYHFVSKINNKTLNLNLTNPIFIYGASDFTNCSYCNLIKNVKGKKPKNENEIIVSSDFLDNYNKRIGEKINIDGIKYKIVGTYKLENSLMGEPIFTNLKTIEKNYNYEKNKINAFFIISNDPNISKKIKFKFDKLQVQDTEEMKNQLEKILFNLNLLIFLIAFIAGIIAAIGIINTTLMSILERFKEIGTLKAVGWTKENILIMILLETIFISIIGLVIGIFVSLILISIINYFSNFTLILKPTFVMYVVIFSFLFGLIAGLYPAYTASKLDPIVALRNI